MQNNQRSRQFPPKGSMILLLALLLIAAAAATAIGLMDGPPGQHQNAAPPSSSVTPEVTLSPIPVPTPKDDIGQVPHPPSASVPRAETSTFAYAACPRDVRIEPDVKAESGFARTELPRGLAMEGIVRISTGHLFDAAGYGNEFGTSYALAEDGSIYRWGLLDWETRKHPVAFPEKAPGMNLKVKQLEGRFVLAENGDVYDLNARDVPVRIEGLSSSAGIVQADDTSLYAIRSNGEVRLFEHYGPTGKPAVRNVDGLGKVLSLAASPYITLALDSESKLWMAPPRFSSSTLNKPKPLELPNNERAVQLDATMSYRDQAYILTDKSRWYRINEQGTLELAVVPEGTVHVTATERTTAALKADGTVWIWGEGSTPLNPSASIIPAERPLQIEGLAGIAALSAGSDHMLALTKEGKVLALGSNMYGQLGRFPVYTDTPVPIGQWPGVDTVVPFYSWLFAVKDGDLWSMEGDGTFKPVLIGQQVKKADTALGHFIVLTKDGRLIVAEPNEDKSCKVVHAPGNIADAASAFDGMLLALEDGRVFHVKGSTHELQEATELQFEPKPSGKVISVYGDPIPFALTDQGELYYRERTVEGGIPIMKPVTVDASIKQWSPMHYDFTDGYCYTGKALDQNNLVYEVTVKLNRDGDPELETASVQARQTGETASLLMGGALIDGDGGIREQSYLAALDTLLPAGTRLQRTASLYHLPMEGRSYYHHIIVADDGTIFWLGNMPTVGWQATPDFVSHPH